MMKDIWYDVYGWLVLIPLCFIYWVLTCLLSSNQMTKMHRWLTNQLAKDERTTQ